MKPPTSHLATWAVVVVVLATLRVAAAAPELTFETRPPVAATDKVPSPAPSLVVRIVGGGSGLPETAFTLRQLDARLPTLKATSVMRYLDGPEPVGIAVVIEGHGNYLAAQPGLADAIKAALGALAKAGPAGSQATVLLYGAKVEVKMAAGPLEKIGEVEVVPSEPAGPTVARNLGGAITKAIEELEKMPVARRVLIVIGDGLEGEGSVGPSATSRTLLTKLTEKGITAHAVVIQFDRPTLGAPVPPEIDPDTNEFIGTPDERTAFTNANKDWKRKKDNAFADLKVMTAENVQRVVVKGIEGAVGAIAAALDDRIYVTFPGFDPVTKAGVTWDGKEHQLMLRIDGADTTATAVKLEPTWSPPGKGGMWWIWVLVGGGALVVLGVVIAIVKKPKPIPLPPPVAAPPPPPQPQVRQKTMFVAADGGDSVFPMVGWVVFMNGPKRLKFHRIKQGVTKIGTGTNSDVVIDDGYMSTDHSLILMTPEGFWVQDNNSTNGTFLNDNKLAKKEELYDNDLILVGKTVLKFKSVM